MKEIPYDRRFYKRITKMNSDFCYKELICDYNISELILSFKFDYENDKSFITISNGYIEYGFETPKITIPTGISHIIAIECAGYQQQIDTWIKILKESLEWYLPNYFYKYNVKLTIKDTCVYADKLFFTNNIITDELVFVAHPYLKEKYPEIYKNIKETDYSNYKEINFSEYKKMYTDFTKKI